MIRRILKAGIGIVILILIVGTHGFSQHYLQREDAWVNATISNMTLDEKVGQLFMVRAFSKGYAGEEKKISDYIYKVPHRRDLFFSRFAIGASQSH